MNIGPAAPATAPDTRAPVADLLAMEPVDRARKLAALIRGAGPEVVDRGGKLAGSLNAAMRAVVADATPNNYNTLRFNLDKAGLLLRQGDSVTVLLSEEVRVAPQLGSSDKSAKKAAPAKVPAKKTAAKVASTKAQPVNDVALPGLADRLTGYNALQEQLADERSAIIDEVAATFNSTDLALVIAGLENILQARGAKL